MEHQSLTKDQQEKWEEKKLRAAERVEKLNAELNENLAGRIMAAFQDGVDMHCPHGLPVAQEDGKKLLHRPQCGAVGNGNEGAEILLSHLRGQPLH